MSKRDDTLQQDGPILTEAAIMALLDEINTLREVMKLEAVPIDNVLDSINSHIANLEPYPWLDVISKSSVKGKGC